jgi:nicotinamidase-related amidase
MTKRLRLDQCQAVIVDVQGYFLDQLRDPERMAIEEGTVNATKILRYLQIPVLFTLERPLETKGTLPKEIPNPVTLEKDFFDLTKERPIRDHLAAAGRQQVILFGCETDVCILQSCLGLLDLGYEVYLIKNLIFTSGKTDVSEAFDRMRDAGAVVLSYKTMFHELFEAQERSPHRRELTKKLGPFPSRGNIG